MPTKPAKTTDAVEILLGMDRDPETLRVVREEYTKQSIASAIYTLRKQHRWTQQRLAQEIGTTQSVIARLEDADYEGHSLTMLTRIAAALGYAIKVAFVPIRPNASKRRSSATVSSPLPRARAPILRESRGP